MRYVYHVDDEVKIVDVEREGDELRVTVDERVHKVSAIARGVG